MAELVAWISLAAVILMFLAFLVRAMKSIDETSDQKFD